MVSKTYLRGYLIAVWSSQPDVHWCAVAAPGGISVSPPGQPFSTEVEARNVACEEAGRQLGMTPANLEEACRVLNWVHVDGCGAS